jgi:hypothetical protein
MNYESTVTMDAQSCHGVRFTIARMSFGRRLELTRAAREIGARIEYDRAGTSTVEKLDAAIGAAEVERLYLRWGLKSVEGLSIDGDPAGVEQLLEVGPEDLVREIVAAIKRECGLSAEERKN